MEKVSNHPDANYRDTGLRDWEVNMSSLSQTALPDPPFTSLSDPGGFQQCVFTMTHPPVPET